jgi:hypothetical protein
MQNAKKCTKSPNELRDMYCEQQNVRVINGRHSSQHDYATGNRV